MGFMEEHCCLILKPTQTLGDVLVRVGTSLRSKTTTYTPTFSPSLRLCDLVSQTGQVFLAVEFSVRF